MNLALNVRIFYGCSKGCKLSNGSFRTWAWIKLCLYLFELQDYGVTPGVRCVTQTKVVKAFRHPFWTCTRSQVGMPASKCLAMLKLCENLEDTEPTDDNNYD